MTPRQRALAGVVERAARSAHAGSLVLRGGLVLRGLVAPTPRTVHDVDFLGLDPFDAVSVQPALADILATDVGDGVSYTTPRFGIIWAETEHPGVRGQCASTIGDQTFEIQIDVGFGDPRVAPDVPFTLPGTETPMMAAAAETLLAWKIHGLFERGRGQWRPKDLFDVIVLGAQDGLDHAILPECLRVAFASHGDDFGLMDRFFDGEWGQSRGSRRKWRSYRNKHGDGVPPEDFDEVIASARRIVRAIVGGASPPRRA